MSSITAARAGWRTPAVILLCGSVIALVNFGPRSALGLFLTPLSTAHDWGRDVFALAIALQNLLWGAAQPFAGAIADRFGTVRVLSGGAILYGLGLALMVYSTTPAMLHLTAGVMIGFGLAGCSFTIVLAALGKLMPLQYRSLAFGLATAAGSFGQFLYSPLAVLWTGLFGWQNALFLFAAMMLLVIPLSFALSIPRMSRAAGPAAGDQQSAMRALTEACGHRSYVLLVIGFFTCGFQLAFITVHMPAYLVDRGLNASVGGWALAVIGLFNIIGSITSGWLGDRMPKRYLLSLIYLLRAVSVAAFVTFPVTPASAMIFGASMGLLWLSTVPPTNGIVALMFGTRWLALLTGFAFFSHQVGGFLGVWLGGLFYERTGSYDVVWWLSVLFGVVSAIINLPIVERPVDEPAPLPA